jgi:predicted ATP-binding protein involved in virulence
MATPKRQTRKNGKIEKKKATPFYFLSLTVENVSCFGEKQILDLSNGKGRPAQWTIILGDNGVGKTTLLQSIAAIAPIKELNNTFAPALYDDDYLGTKWKPQRYDGDNDSCSLSTSLLIGSSLIDSSGGEKLSDFNLVSGAGNWASLVTMNRFGISWGISTEAPLKAICFGYGASRRMSETAISDKTDLDATISLFSDKVALLNAEEWLLQADYSAHFPSSIQERAREQRDKVREILVEILPDVADIKFVPPTEEKMLPQIRVETPYGWVSIKDLSLGYRTLIAWMVDFARRMFEFYPDEPKPLEQAAVVLVDEIDLHLHPKMQRELMSRLSKIFPNTQFIATAHSPLVVQAATDANIVLLRREGDHVVIDNDPQTIQGWRVDQILTSELFGLESARPPAYDAVVAEREKILSKTRLTKKDKERLHELAAKISEFPTGETPLEIEAMDIVRRAAQRLKKENHRTNDSHQ